ncbi:hypothetical protein N6G05_26620 [Cupriavidus gilardii]|nr:hypothetical protein [Cupriavidus gilardii]MCT9017129.1 hypothetical protein [Cupriavidus gilardii]MCT9056799.1 hypothetical protein [Cupriavidus gilardii]QKS60877.1 hypothetical protein FOB47_02615 [Cupriavidus gilardii]
MGELNLDELGRLAKAATPGPWEWWTSNSFLRLSGSDGRDGGVLYACNIRNEYATVVVSEADRRFIAEARTALPALIARIRELEQENAALRTIAERYRFLRDEHIGDDPDMINLARGKRRGLDAAIDAAIDAARKEKGHG